MMNYAQVLEQIEQLKIGKKEPDFEAFLEKISFKKVLYIPEGFEYDFVGEFAEAILKKHGYSVGRLTSYAIKRPLGHILYNGKAISQKDFTKYGELILENKECGELPGIFSDIATGAEVYLRIALEFFLDKNIDVLILPSNGKCNFDDLKETLAESSVSERDEKCIGLVALFLKREGFTLKEKLIEKAIGMCKSEGRFELLKMRPYFIADGADNGSSVKLLMAKLQYTYPNNPYIFIVGTMQEGYEELVKESALMAQQILTVTPPECRNALQAIELAKECGKLNSNITNASSIEEAVEIAKILADKDAVIVAFGTTAILERYRDIVLDRVRRNT